jgi:hypothetical protein
MAFCVGIRTHVIRGTTVRIPECLSNNYSFHFIGFVCDFIDFVGELTIKTTEHTVASYESSDFTYKILTVHVKR